MKSMILAALLALSGCATTQVASNGACPSACYDLVAREVDQKGNVTFKQKRPACDASCYAYTGTATKAECEAECGSRGYKLLTVQNGACICDPSTCVVEGGCPGLQAAPFKLNKPNSNQM